MEEASQQDQDRISSASNSTLASHAGVVTDILSLLITSTGFSSSELAIRDMHSTSWAGGYYGCCSFKPTPIVDKDGYFTVKNKMMRVQILLIFPF
ncbi:hypothetical protein L1987_00182 [Smallanthus sonchifolius]|uniref:Uncharacterized protein n=1 Tax=Smallanthus sonchifolius TaxID=185202 RepID=A0ACB9K1H4_9ASTR|nr:hypothetical protein L1987_00182 [Smallanthus sonchifolius]